METEQYDAVISTDLAVIGLQFEDEALIKLAYLDEGSPLVHSEMAEDVKSSIDAYLDPLSRVKNIEVLSALQVTDFQGSVLQQLNRIPYGETRTYGEIAKILDTSARAVGNACRKNPLPLIIPCHRVVAANGMGGYDGAKSGRLLEIKKQLLALEGVCF